MECVRGFIDASKLESVISLPETFKNRRLEIIILPVERTTEKDTQSKQIKDIVDLLTGAISDNP